MKIRTLAAFGAVMGFPLAAASYPGGTPTYQTDVAPFCAGCHASRDAAALAGAEDLAREELAERKHIALILAGQQGYATLSETDRQAAKYHHFGWTELIRQPSYRYSEKTMNDHTSRIDPRGYATAPTEVGNQGFKEDTEAKHCTRFHCQQNGACGHDDPTIEKGRHLMFSLVGFFAVPETDYRGTFQLSEAPPSKRRGHLISYGNNTIA